MTTPINLTHAEVGAYLAAIGEHMMQHDVAALTVESELGPGDVVFDQRTVEMRETIAENMASQMAAAGFTPWDRNLSEREASALSHARCLERAEDVVAQLTLQEAIEFICLPELK